MGRPLKNGRHRVHIQAPDALLTQLGVEFDSRGKDLRHGLVTDLQCLL